MNLLRICLFTLAFLSGSTALAIEASMPECSESAETTKANILAHARIDGLPFSPELFTQVIWEDMLSPRARSERRRSDVAYLVGEISARAAYAHLDLATALTVVWHESHYQVNARSYGGTGEDCGPAQRRARYSMDPPLRTSVGVEPCRTNPRCESECLRLQTDLDYAITQLIDYLVEIQRASNGRLRAQICRYNHGMYATCSPETSQYSQRHNMWRERLMRHYVSRLRREVFQAGVEWAAFYRRNQTLPYPWRPT